MKRKPTPAQIAARERFAEMARSGAFKRKAKRNPAKKTVSQKISQLTREGYPQKQAVAIALNEERAGKVKRNPAKPGVTEIHLGGSYYGRIAKDDTGAFYTVVVYRMAGYGDDIVGDFKPKHYSTMKNAVNALMKYKEKLGYEQRQTELYRTLKERKSRASNPIILVSDKPKRVTRKSNPTKYRDTAKAVPESRVLYSVHLATQRPSIASGGMFTSKQNAMRVAQVIADSTGKTYAVSRLERK